MNRPTLHNRRGYVGLTLALSMLLLVFIMVSTSMLHTATGLMQSSRARHSVEALYAAEGGLDVALQSRTQGILWGNVGEGRYLAQVTPQRVVCLGLAPQATGTPVYAAITVSVSGGRPVRGTWRREPPGRYPDLMRQLSDITARKGATP
ncbi:MAG: hypothetical protein ABFE07_08075 [Armatimonadia bacterium]